MFSSNKDITWASLSQIYSSHLMFKSLLTITNTSKSLIRAASKAISIWTPLSSIHSSSIITQTRLKLKSLASRDKTIRQSRRTISMQWAVTMSLHLREAINPICSPLKTQAPWSCTMEPWDILAQEPRWINLRHSTRTILTGSCLTQKHSIVCLHSYTKSILRLVHQDSLQVTTTWLR